MLVELAFDLFDKASIGIRGDLHGVRRHSENF